MLLRILILTFLISFASYFASLILNLLFIVLSFYFNFVDLASFTTISNIAFVLLL